jgi:hypothetical protein
MAHRGGSDSVFNFSLIRDTFVFFVSFVNVNYILYSVDVGLYCIAAGMGVTVWLRVRVAVARESCDMQRAADHILGSLRLAAPTSLS